MSNQANKNKIISRQEYTTPKYMKNAFHCPHCNTYSNQKWFPIGVQNLSGIERKIYIFLEEMHSIYLKADKIQYIVRRACEIIKHHTVVRNGVISFCDCCKKSSVWINEKIVYPQVLVGALPVAEMPDSVKDLYNEARAICNQSPRGACALLRLAIQILIKGLGENEENLNKAIGNLVQKGLPKKIQKALDFVRITGNKAVHPGKINIQDNSEIAGTLFMLVNFICEKMITENEKVEEIFNTLPETTKKAIKNRDNRPQDTN